MDMPFLQTNNNLDAKLETPLDKGLAGGNVGATPLSPKVPMAYLWRLAQTTQIAIDVLGSFLDFDSLHKFF